MRKFASGRVRNILIRSIQQQQIRPTSSSSSVFSSSRSRFLSSSAAPAVDFPPSLPPMADHSAPVTLQNINPKVMDIKRLNNMMSEHGIYSHERLLIPVSNAEILSEATCYVEVDNYAKREVTVLYLEGGPDPKTINSGIISSSSVLQSKKRVVESLRRSLRVDDATASYYLSIADGDPRAAISQFSQDLKWETNTHLGFA
ncbi:hypothetical protein C1H46_004709 [Malus baccata]|uniref:Uncharacterized protein n=2 Tax=Malus baccata TaxID=106549 RepID=A0A540NFE8_MALBA|nr:hypothetical protein C1H46_004709 [Malus baccata]